MKRTRLRVVFHPDCTPKEVEGPANLVKKYLEELVARRASRGTGADPSELPVFYQKVAPSVKSIMANADGPFAELFKQFLVNPPAPKSSGADKAKVTQAQP